MGSRLRLTAFAALALACGEATALAAQVARRPHVVVVPPLTAVAVSNLTFGTVLPGIPVRVGATDPAHAGQFEIQGPPTASVRVELTLPAALVSGGGATLPLSFGASDALAVVGGHTVMFDPHTPLVAALGADGRLELYLGGEALPAVPQAGGSYHGTIALAVYALGS